MWALFGPSKVFIVFGLVKDTGLSFYRERYLGCFSNRRVAEAFAEQIRSAGKVERYTYFKVEVREESVQD